MKPFNEMTSYEIQRMSDEDFKAVSPFEKKSCANCGHIQEVLSLWCGSAEARKARGTGKPGCIKCTYWKPDWKYIPDQYKTTEYGYVEPMIIKIINTSKTTSRNWIKTILKKWKSKL